MRTRTVAILLILLLVLAPTWFAAVQTSGEHVGEVEIDTSETDMRPLQTFLATPAEFTPAQVGVVIWIALGLLGGLLAVVHRAMHGSGEAEPDVTTADATSPWFQTDHRWIAEFQSAAESADGLYVILGLIAATVAFALLAIMEFTTLARTQYIGLYVGGLFFTLGGATAAYSAWFLPHVTVAEERYHG
ncbi:hypothetical protein [Halodesulfurarchaeum sp.]|uniref:hypothetical protein n=1 Tax=Halodesulfurarchaeum sp. TaxID=1980530 RepID=UPI001BBFAA32|nr:hypothetical protein [Halodesulfurarchaeum sp.]